jgi:hypothetical protein
MYASDVSQGDSKDACETLRIQRHPFSCIAFFLGSPQSAEHLIYSSFGIRRLKAIAKWFPASPEVVEILGASNRCQFAMLISLDARVREEWAKAMGRAGCDPLPACSGESVIVDFLTVPSDRPCSMLGNVKIAFSYLWRIGFSAILSECQDLRQLVFWLRHGAKPLNPPSFDPFQRLLNLKRCASRPPAQSSASPLTDVLHGEVLSSNRAPGDRFNVCLGAPVFLSFDLTGNSHRASMPSRYSTEDARSAPPASPRSAATPSLNGECGAVAPSPRDNISAPSLLHRWRQT